MIIGLTGKSCSGKDTVASLLDERFVVIDEDALGHRALENNVDRIREAFGDGVISNGAVDRKKLGSVVFSSPEKLAELNSISHPWMVAETLRMCREIEDEGKIAVINAAILEEMGFVKYCSEIIFVLSPYEKRLQRALRRDGVSEEGFRKRSESQKEIGATLFSCGKKVVTIINDKEKEELSRQVASYCASMKKVRVQ